MPLEILDFPLVFFRCFPRIECAEIFSFTLSGFFTRIESELSAADFSYHRRSGIPPITVAVRKGG